MPDISMCQQDKCPVKDTCYRYMATPCPYRQSYMLITEFDDDGCRHYWKMSPCKDDDKVAIK
jgi:hypothetical protein